MGWKGTLRSVKAEMNRMERESERKHKAEQKEQKIAAASDVVARAEDYMLRITSMHHECLSPTIDWEVIAHSLPPVEPTSSTKHIDKANAEYEGFKENFIHKLLKRGEKVKTKLGQEIPKAKERDEQEYQTISAEYVRDFHEWQENSRFANRLLAGDIEARAEVFKRHNVCAGIEELGTELRFSLDDNGNVTITINVHGDEVIPTEKYSQLQSGMLSTKAMPKGEFHALYQDYVCSCTLRVASEIFAILPVESVLINASDDLLNPATGHLEQQVILSVLVMRETLKMLNLSFVDPSDALTNFVHNMNFKKTAGFSPVEAVDFQLAIAV